MLNAIRHWNHRRRLATINTLCELPVPLLLSDCQRALVFAPHPDDETLGCGGTLCLLSKHCAVKVILVTDGGGAGDLPPSAVEIRRQEFIQALNILGVNDYELWNYTDGLFFDSKQFYYQASEILDMFKPQWVFFPSPLDYHRDHLNLSIAIHHVCFERKLTQIYYEVWSPLVATHYVDISDVMTRKLNALDCYHTALSSGPYRTAVTGLNAFRSLYMMNRDKSCFAEAFCVDVDGSLSQTLINVAFLRIK